MLHFLFLELSTAYGYIPHFTQLLAHVTSTADSRKVPSRVFF